MFDDDDFMMDGDGDDFSGDDFCDDDSMGGDGDEPVEMEETAENLYYKSKSTVEDSVQEAEKELRRVVELDQAEPSEYGFKALKKIVKMMLRDAIPSEPDQIIKDFKEMLTYANVVSVNMTEKGIGAVLDIAVASKKLALMEELAQLSGECFMKNKNERAWFRTNLKLVQTLFEAGHTESVAANLAKLIEWCELAPGVNNPRKESFLLEVLALKMQSAVSGEITGKDGLRRLVSRAAGIQSAIPHPRTLGTIHECTGKVMMYERHWSEAKQEFFDAFKNYDESGSPRRLVCLRYILLAALLENSEINPFESPETKSLVGHEEIKPVVALWNAFEALNVPEFNAALQNAFAKDPFGCDFVPLVIRSFQHLKIAEIVKAYSKVRISFIADQLNISEAECEEILVELILEGRLNGLIDQASNVLLIDEESAHEDDAKYDAMARWSRHVATISQSVSKKVLKLDRSD